MEVYCTRPGCPRPQNFFGDLDDTATLRTVQQKYCTTCGMPLILAGRYLASKLLGRGGFGAAFKACDRYTPGMRSCVVKQFQPSSDLTSKQLELAQKLFEREAEVLEQLGNQHDQIPDLFAFFELSISSLQPEKQDKFFYLVQEFIDGETLEQELKQRGKFSEKEIRDVLLSILPVLQFVHEHGSIHRDIKPSNIMRHRNGKFYLLDFGAVKQVTKVVGTSRSSTGIYSIGFAPPEQMAGGEVYPSTDLYALAVTCITLLTGQEATQLFDTYNSRWNWRPQTRMSHFLADVLDRMLLPTPNQRFVSAKEVIAALTKPQNPSLATPTSSSPPASSVSGVRPSRKTFSTLEVLAGAGFSGFEGGLIAIALYSLLKSLPMTLAIGSAVLAVIIFLQFRRWIEKTDLVVIALVTLAAIFFVPALRGTLSFPEVAILAIAPGLVAIALTALFRLIYKLLSLIF